ncbi:MAG: hypothetical protein U5R31_13900 [Acidimicrobiia bacterium]|nr:hypothetical protein [Acidimicrobiia bacterium]
MIERLLLEDRPGDRRGVAQVLMGELFDVMRRVAALLLPTFVVVPRELLEELGPVDQLAELEHEQARPLPVGEQHAEAVELLEHALELADGGQVVDHAAGRGPAPGTRPPPRAPRRYRRRMQARVWSSDRNRCARTT